MRLRLSSAPGFGSVAGLLWAFGGFLVLAVAWTWPLARHITRRVPQDQGDPLLNTWILWWNTQALPFTSAWWSPPVFYPMPGSLALSEHLLGVSAITTPLQWLGVGALTAYNISLILSFALSGFFTFLLVRYLATRGAPKSSSAATAAALIAGVAYGFAPYRASQLAHLQVLHSQWMPLALLAMHGYVDRGRRAWLALFAIAWLLQALSNGYYLLFFPVLIALWLAYFVDWRRAPRRGLHLVATWSAASLLLVPGLLEYRGVHAALGLARSFGEMLTFSGDLAAFTRRPPQLAFWPNLTSTNQETFLYPGIVAAILVIAGLAWPRRPVECVPADRARRPLLFYAGATVIASWLALGPAPAGAGIGVLGFPYTLLTYLPGFSALRVPARLVMLAYLCLAVAAGLGFARLAPTRPSRLRLMTAVVVAALAFDAWPRVMPLTAVPPRVLLPDVPGAAVLELPPDEDAASTAAMYRAMQHGRPLINGYSGHRPPHYRILAHSLRSGDPTVITQLARLRPLIIAINADWDRDGGFLDVVQSVPGIERRSVTSLGPVFLLPKQPALRVPPAGTALPFRAHTEGTNAAVLDLGRVHVVRTLGFPLRGHHRDFGARVEIEGSTDGRTWKSLWLDWTGGLALAGALEDPLVVPVRFVLPDVTVRYLRIHPVEDWMLREMQVESSVHRFIESSVHRFIDSSVHRFIGSSVHRFIGSSIHRSIDSSIHRPIGSSDYRSIDEPMIR